MAAKKKDQNGETAESRRQELVAKAYLSELTPEEHEELVFLQGQVEHRTRPPQVDPEQLKASRALYKHIPRN